MSEQGVIPHRLGGAEAGSTSYVRAGHGEPLVLIHGVGMNASIWTPQIEALRNDFDVVAYDMLGHGGSSRPSADVKLLDYADQLRSVLDALRLDRAHVVGHSMGALVALEFALAHSARVGSVAALNAVYCRTSEQRAAVEQRAAALNDGRGTVSPDGTIARWFGDPLPDGVRRAAETVRNLLEAVDPIGYARTYRLFATSDDALRGRLGALNVPALFMTGELDPNSTPAMSQAMAKEAIKGRCEIISGERHMMPVTAPCEVNQRLRAFLTTPSNRPTADSGLR
jgi:pimeloyl-ACP methyl ester carboxylesterase